VSPANNGIYNIPANVDLRAYHASEIPFLFEADGSSYFNQSDIDLSHQMQNLWRDFAVNGKPAQQIWPPYEPDSQVSILAFCFGFLFLNDPSRSME